MAAVGIRATSTVPRSRSQATRAPTRCGIEPPPQPADAPRPKAAPDGCPTRKLAALQRPRAVDVRSGVPDAVQSPGRAPKPATVSWYRLTCADWREPTSGLEPLTCSLPVSGQALQGFARTCKSPLSKRLSFPQLAPCCTVLRSRWCQSGVKRRRIFGGCPNRPLCR